MTTLREAAQQALERLRQYHYGNGFAEDAKCIADLEAALAQQAEPVAGKVVAWGVFANIDGEWQLQHPVFAGDEQGKVNSEFERASYSGPQPLEVRPLGVVTATAQQAEPLNLRDPAVQKRLATQWGYVPAAAQAEPVEPVDVGLLEYRGNSVAFIHQKMTAYRSGIDAAWDAFRAKGLHPDGKTSLADMIAKHTALVAAAERDACAALLEANGMRCGEESLSRLILETNAAAIRARTP